MHSTVSKVKECRAESGHASNPFRVKGLGVLPISPRPTCITDWASEYIANDKIHDPPPLLVTFRCKRAYVRVPMPKGPRPQIIEI